MVNQCIANTVSLLMTTHQEFSTSSIHITGTFLSEEASAKFILYVGPHLTEGANTYRTCRVSTHFNEVVDCLILMLICHILMLTSFTKAVDTNTVPHTDDPFYNCVLQVLHRPGS